MIIAVNTTDWTQNNVVFLGQVIWFWARNILERFQEIRNTRHLKFQYLKEETTNNRSHLKHIRNCYSLGKTKHLDIRIRYIMEWYIKCSQEDTDTLSYLDILLAALPLKNRMNRLHSYYIHTFFPSRVHILSLTAQNCHWNQTWNQDLSFLYEGNVFFLAHTYKHAYCQLCIYSSVL